MEQVETDSSLQRRKKDRQLGFLVSMGVNLLMSGLWLGVGMQAAGFSEIPSKIWLAVPWAVNLCALAGALIFRPQFAVGYLAFFVVAIAGSVVLGVMFMVACFTSLGTMAVLQPLGDTGMLIGFFIALPVVFLGGLFLAGRPLVRLIVKVWKGTP